MKYFIVGEKKQVRERESLKKNIVSEPIGNFIYTSGLTFKNYTFHPSPHPPTECFHVFWVGLRTNSNYFPIKR